MSGDPIARSIVGKLYPELCEHDRRPADCQTCEIKRLRAARDQARALLREMREHFGPPHRNPGLTARIDALLDGET